MSDCKMADVDRPRVEDGFLAFETKPGSGIVNEKDLPTILRAAGLQLHGDQILEIINQVLDVWLAAHKKEVRRASYVQLLTAIKSLDKDGRGYFAPEELMALFVNQGEQFSSQEATAMLSAAVDKQSNRIYAEDLGALLSRKT
eukprot:jgi/Botrbrau1/6884/Bobra.67_3s0005.2